MIMYNKIVEVVNVFVVFVDVVFLVVFNYNENVLIYMGKLIRILLVWIEFVCLFSW